MTPPMILSRSLAWLRSTLADARQQHEKVWLIYHVPPGMDGYASSRQAAAVPLWKAVYAQAFDDLTSTYSDVITASFAGHNHVDDFRLVGSPASHETLVMIAPALSPSSSKIPLSA